ncbi:MAG: hypothetical protein IT376_00475 [Polyangiaceae bacterium]|nr:hypothetical protein [Polyangiaceae bacterium]
MTTHARFLVGLIGGVSLSPGALGCAGGVEPKSDGAGGGGVSASAGAAGSGGSTATGGVGAEGGGAGGATGGTTGGGAAGMTGGGSAGASGSTGMPITAPANEWTWVGDSTARCRDASEAGFGIRINPASDRLMIFLEGGGACFNGVTCATSPSSFGPGQFQSWKTNGGTRGLFDRARDENPVKDWSHVYVPYCTGDVHAGARPDASGIAGIAGTNQFVGYTNMTQFLRRIAATFPDATQVLLTGVSAGGFGATANFPQTQRLFGDIPVTLIDDSGPPMSRTYITECLQERFRTSWGLDQTLLADCGPACPNENDYLADYARFLASYGNRTVSLISSRADSVITFFYGFGLNDCPAFALPMPPAMFAQGLDELRGSLWAGYSNVGTFFVNGATHTFLGGNDFYSTSAAGTSLVSWVAHVLAGSPSHVGP